MWRKKEYQMKWQKGSKLLAFGLILYWYQSLNKKMVNAAEREKQKKEVYYLFVSQWMHRRNAGYHIKDYFIKNQIFRVGIYGAGVIGKLIYEELRGSEIEVSYFIDQQGKDIKSLYEGIPVYEMKNVRKAPKVDVVIVSLLLDYNAIQNDLLRVDKDINLISAEKIMTG